METQKNIIEIEDYIVEFINKLTWGKQEEIRGTMYKGLRLDGKTSGEAKVEFDVSAISTSKYKAIEVCIDRVKDKKTGEYIPFTIEWLNNLSVEDGDKIYEVVQKITEKKN
jgi:hypothetical protein